MGCFASKEMGMKKKMGMNGSMDQGMNSGKNDKKPMEPMMGGHGMKSHGMDAPMDSNGKQMKPKDKKDKMGEGSMDSGMKMKGDGMHMDKMQMKKEEPMMVLEPGHGS